MKFYGKKIAAKKKNFSCTENAAPHTTNVVLFGFEFYMGSFADSRIVSACV